jgi:hypothetical protein
MFVAAEDLAGHLQLLRFPKIAAVRGAKDVPGPPHGQAVLLGEHVDVENLKVRAAIAHHPTCASVRGLNRESTRAHHPTVLRIGEVCGPYIGKASKPHGRLLPRQTFVGASPNVAL